jgi:predicted RNA-binding protein with PUA domain
MTDFVHRWWHGGCDVPLQPDAIVFCGSHRTSVPAGAPGELRKCREYEIRSTNELTA